MMADFQLTAQQKRFFDTFGFLKFEGLFKEELLEINAGFHDVFNKFGGNFNGKPHNFRNSSAIVGILGHNERLAALLDDQRVQSICSTLLGEDYNYLTSAGNISAGNAGWHSDTLMNKNWPEHVKSINLSWYLDPTTEETGAIRFLMGSHFVGDQYTEMLKDIFPAVGESRKLPPAKEIFGVEVDELPAVTVSVRPGDLLVFNNFVKHASFGGGTHRRFLLLNFSRRYPDEWLDELKAYVSTFAPYWVEEIHGEAVLANPDRWPHLEQIQQNQAHLPELARAAKARAMEQEKAQGKSGASHARGY